MNRLYFLELTDDEPSYDTFVRFVIRAPSTAEARAIAYGRSMDRDWCNPEKSSCCDITECNEVDIVLGQYNQS